MLGCSRDRRRPAPARQARRRDPVRVRRQQSAKARRWWRRVRSPSGADTLITAGGIQSNHARATAASPHGMGTGRVLVANGEPPGRADGQRAARPPARRRGRLRRRARGARADDGADGGADAARTEGGRFVIPLGASTPLGAAGLRARDRASCSSRCLRPTAIVHVDVVGRHAGRPRRRLPAARISTRVVGISADDPSASICGRRCARIIERHRRMLERSIRRTCRRRTAIEVDDQIRRRRLWHTDRRVA